VSKLLTALRKKLSPDNVRVSPMFHAVLACLLGAEGWARPNLAALTVTSDGFLLGMVEGDIGHNCFIGPVSTLEKNIRGVAEVVGLTDRQTKHLLSLVPKPRVAVG
jgi:hypothetical protein